MSLELECDWSETLKSELEGIGPKRGFCEGVESRLSLPRVDKGQGGRQWLTLDKVVSFQTVGGGVWRVDSRFRSFLSRTPVETDVLSESRRRKIRRRRNCIETASSSVYPESRRLCTYGFCVHEGRRCKQCTSCLTIFVGHTSGRSRIHSLNATDIPYWNLSHYLWLVGSKEAMAKEVSWKGWSLAVNVSVHYLTSGPIRRKVLNRDSLNYWIFKITFLKTFFLLLSFPI